MLKLNVRTTEPRAAMVPVVAGYLAGSIPFSNLASRAIRGIDLREVETGTVSGTSLYRVAGFGPLAVAGVLEVAKGAIGPALAGPERPGAAILAAGGAVAAHNWSPWLRGAGGRGISPALGALMMTAPEGAGLLVAGLIAGRAGGETAAGCLVAYLALGPVLARRRGRFGALLATAVLVPMFAKRAAGNGPPATRDWRTYACRLVLDRDTVRIPVR
jgi:acyl phosphate:glycerol-3-phosphate acyltransferase